MNSGIIIVIIVGVSLSRHNSYFPVSFEEMDDFVFDSEFHSLGK